ncbi:exocyst complex component EXO70C1-like [Cornus florida]|uniref:exocyst complex component EXO70C1-like n=1 Tax=Cornus florida TaxID=4283 RepID=UPI0028A225D9|nr:exocyst complex component EXO70C1-like [Cornus florida]
MVADQNGGGNDCRSRKASMNYGNGGDEFGRSEPIEIEVVESPIQIQAVEILSQLKEAVRGTLLQLEKEVCHEQSTILVPGGIIHSLTRYVMDYTIRVSEYKQSLTSIIVSKPSIYLKYLDDETIIHMDYIEVEGQTSLALHLIWIIQNLVRQLNVKSKYYDDADLALSFMVDNVLYILQKIIGCSELRMVIGNHLLNKLYRLLIHYVRVSTLRIESSMRPEKLGTSGCCSSGMSRIALREMPRTRRAMLNEAGSSLTKFMQLHLALNASCVLPCREECRRNSWRWILTSDSIEENRNENFEREERPPNIVSPLLARRRAPKTGM